MIFKLKPTKNKFLESAYEKAMKELNVFYGINWVHHRPNVFIVEDRESIDALKMQNTEEWLIGWTNGRDVYLLDKNKTGKESEKKYNKAEYEAFVKHELSHSFFKILSGGKPFPSWLWEGVAIYTSGQCKFKKRPDTFKDFLSFWDKWGSEMYRESGFVVETLVEKFGKKKLLDIIGSLKNVSTPKDFDKLFLKIYGFKLSYKEINKLWNK